MKHGFVRVAAAIPSVRVADCTYNTERIVSMMKDADNKGASIIVFPELSITGYTCGDLFQQSLLIDKANASLGILLEQTAGLDIIAIIGIPVATRGTLLNAAAVVQKGKILGVIPKTHLPNYKEFYEKRWFSSAWQTEETEIEILGHNVPMHTNLVFSTPGANFAVEICEDLWATIPPSSQAALNGAEIIFNLSADNELVGKNVYLHSLLSQQSARTISAYVFSSCGFGESTTDTVFAGNAIICENGEVVTESERFKMEEQLVITDIDIDKIRHLRQINTTFAESRSMHASVAEFVQTLPVEEKGDTTLLRKIDSHPFIPSADRIDECCREILSIQSLGLAKRLLHTHAKSSVVGISGGLDSTLALLVCVNTYDMLGLDRKGIVGVTMPGFGTTDRTYHNAVNLMRQLGITVREISIKDACLQHFSDIGHDVNNHDVTYENAQARERTQILMDVANQAAGMVIGTGDLSELALGWATYNGDHMSMYGVNASVPKTLVRYVVEWYANNTDEEIVKQLLLDIVNTPISPELIPADEDGNIKQVTEDLVGPYELHDFFLYQVLEYGYSPAKIYYLACNAFEGEFDAATIKKWLTTFFRRFFNQQFKRSCLPDGPKVGLSLSPRGDWRMPSDACSRLWMEECENL